MLISEKSDMLTKEEIARKYRVKLRTVDRWIKHYGLPALKLGGTVRIKRSDLDLWENKSFLQLGDHDKK